MAPSKHSRRKATPENSSRRSTGKQVKEKYAEEEAKPDEREQIDDDDWALGWTLWTAHRARTGSANVPPDHPDTKLVRWAERQKLDYANFNRGESSFLSNGGFSMLSRMGFTWDLKEEDNDRNGDEFTSADNDKTSAKEKSVQTKKESATAWFDEGWETHLQKLLEYNQKHGNVNEIPPRSQLGKWIVALRGHYKEYMNGNSSLLNPERVEMLEGLGFNFIDWETHNLAPLAQETNGARKNHEPTNSDERKPPSRISLHSYNVCEKGETVEPKKRKAPEPQNTENTKKAKGSQSHGKRVPPPRTQNDSTTTNDVELPQDGRRRSLRRSILTSDVSKRSASDSNDSVTKSEVKASQNGQRRSMRRSISTATPNEVEAFQDVRRHSPRRSISTAGISKRSALGTTPSKALATASATKGSARRRAASDSNKPSRQTKSNPIRSMKQNSLSYAGSLSAKVGYGEDLEVAVADALEGKHNVEITDDSVEITVGGLVVMTVREYQRLLIPNEPQDPSKNCSKMQAERNRAWHNRFCALVEYKRIHGHICVPKAIPLNKPSLKSLSTWVYQTRQYKRERDRGAKNTLTKARLQKLADIGFEWNTRRSQQFWHNIANTMNAKSWDAHFNALLKFKAIDGTCLVPKVYPPNPSLSYWVARQRTQMKLKLEGKIHSLTPERERRLMEIDFVFNSKNSETRRFNLMRRFKDQWEDRFERLLRFQKKHGHTWVPKRFEQDTALAGWVCRLRSLIRQKWEGIDNTLSDERMKRLLDIGFQVYPKGQEWKNPTNKLLSKTNAEANISEKEEANGNRRISSARHISVDGSTQKGILDHRDDKMEDYDDEVWDEDNEDNEVDDDDDNDEMEDNNHNADDGDECKPVGWIDEHHCKVCKVAFNSFLEAMAHEARCSGFTDKVRKHVI